MNTNSTSRFIISTLRRATAVLCALALAATAAACGSSSGKVDDKSRTATSVADFGGMDPDLVLPARLQFEFHQGIAGIPFPGNGVRNGDRVTDGLCHMPFRVGGMMASLCGPGP